MDELHPEQPSGIALTLSRQLRQSLQSCSVHGAGPVTIFGRCLDALDSGELTGTQFTSIGAEIARQSRELVRESTADRPDMPVPARLLDRETRIIRFVSALFTLPPAGAGAVAAAAGPQHPAGAGRPGRAGAPATPEGAREAVRRFVAGEVAAVPPIARRLGDAATIFLGSWCTGSADAYSDLDIQVVLPDGDFADCYREAVAGGYAAPGESLLVVARTPVKTVCKVRSLSSLAAELESDPIVALWIFAGAQLLADPGARVRERIDAAAERFGELAEPRCRESFLRLARLRDWLRKLDSRDMPTARTVLLGQFVQTALEICFLAERRPYPYGKWLDHWAFLDTRLGPLIRAAVVELVAAPSRDHQRLTRQIVEILQLELVRLNPAVPWAARPERCIS